MDLKTIGSVRTYANSVKSANSAAANMSNMSGKGSSKSKDYCTFIAAKNPAVEPDPVKTSSEKESARSEEKSISEMIKEQMEKIDRLCSEKEYDKAGDTRLNAIKYKIYNGSTLTYTEQRYLASKDPDAYSSYQNITTARKMYRCSLNSCQTRDQVNSMRLSNSLSALAAYKKAIREGGSGADIIGLNAALENEIRDYAKAGNYQKLPTAAECNKFDADLAKARKYEREKRLEKALDPTGKKKKKTAKFPGDGKRTVAQVMNSPLGKKVMAARRRSSSCTCGASVDYSAKMNVKI